MLKKSNCIIVTHYSIIRIANTLKKPKNGLKPVSIYNLDKIYKPNRIAVVGASDNPDSIGGAILRNRNGNQMKNRVTPQRRFIFDDIGFIDK